MTTSPSRVLVTLLVIAVASYVAACRDQVTDPEVPLQDQPLLSVEASGASIWIGAGDIATCGRTTDDEVANVVDSLLGVYESANVFTAGDNVYEYGTAQEYNDCYEPSWGRFKDRTWATIGNHEYSLGNADPTFDYFGSRVGPRDLGYYSFDAGDWHVVMINSNFALPAFDNGDPVPADADSIQLQWLAQDLATTSKSCVLAVMHHPRFFSCPSGSGNCNFASERMKPLYKVLHDYGADVLVTGHFHHYERFAPQDHDGMLDPEDGIRQFVVGTGGRSVGLRDLAAPNSEARNDANNQFGVLKLTLRTDAYDWEFVPIPGVTFTDSGTAACNGIKPTAEFSWEATDLRIAFKDTSVDRDGTVVAWSWDFGDGNTSNDQNPTHVYADAGLYTITLTVTDDDGKSSTTSQSVPVGPQAPVAGFDWGGGRPLTVLFTDTSTDLDGTVGEWSWDFGDGNTSTLQNPAHTYAALGTYTVTLSITDNDGSTDAISETVTASGASVGQVVYVTGAEFASSVGELSFTDEDIIAYDVGAGSWSMFFDGSDVGLSGSNARDLDAISVLPDGDVLFSVSGATTIPNVGAINPNDIVRFTGTTGSSTIGTFSLYFSGDDFGLATENIDAIGFAPDGRLVVSLAGSFSLPVGTALDEDLIVRDAGGNWSLYFDGSDVGLNDTSSEDVAGLSIDSETGNLYLSTLGLFDVAGLSGDGSDVFGCIPGSLGTTTSCTFDRYFVGTHHGLTGVTVNGVHITGGASPANMTPTASFTYESTGLKADFTDTSMDPDGRVVTWSWDFGDGTGRSTLRNPTYTYASDGTYTVTLTVRDNEDATAGVRQPVTVASNVAPTVSAVAIAGVAAVGQTLTGSYTYADDDGDAEGVSTFRWLRNGQPITGATSGNYTLVAADQGASILFEVTPVAATGLSPGVATSSAGFGPIASAVAAGCPGAAAGGALVRFEDCLEVKQKDKAVAIDLPTPPGTQVGNLLIAAVATHKGLTFTGPAGWTLIDQGESNDDVSVGVWWKIAEAAGTTSHRFGFSDDKESYGWIMRFTGHDPTDPIDGVAAVAADKAKTHISPAVTSTVDQTLVLRLGAFHTDKITTDQPGLPGHIPITMDTAHGHLSAGAGYASQQTVGSSGTSTFTLQDDKTGRLVTIAVKPAIGAPTASFTHASTDLQVDFTDTSADPDGAVVTWSWNFGDGTGTSSAQNPTHTYATAGTYDVTLTVTDNLGETAATTQPVSVPANAPPTASAVSISGFPAVGQALMGSYTYADAEGDAQGTSTFRWLRNGQPIAGATAGSYTLVSADQGASIVLEVTPVAATGTSPGVAAQSAPVGPITSALIGGCPGAFAGGGLVRFEDCLEVKQKDKAVAIDLSAPAATQVGDLLIAAVATHKGLTFTGPAGWTLIDQGTSKDDVSVGVWWKIADAAGTTSHRFGFSDDKESYGWIMRFTGHDPTNPIDAVAAVAAENAKTHISPAVTSTVDQTLVLRIGAFHTDKITTDQPGLPGHIPITMDAAHGHLSGGAGYTSQQTAGSSGTSTFTLNDDKTGRLVTIAVKPMPSN